MNSPKYFLKNVGYQQTIKYSVPEIYAVDISAVMLKYCREQAAKEGLTNIVFCQGGLLTYEHVAELADAVVCVAVLHHLPDFWKQVAITRCFPMLKPGGRLYLFDMVFPSGEIS